MRAIWTLGIVFFGSFGLHAQECAVAINLENPAAARHDVLAQARSTAGRIFGEIGVSLQWDGNADCAIHVQVRLETATSAEERPGSLAYTTLGTSGDRRIHIFMDRVAALAARTCGGPLLGHVIAHEITHVLEGVPRHSDAGLMKAHWQAEDLRVMSSHPLRFAGVDEALIHAALTPQSTNE